MKALLKTGETSAQRHPRAIDHRTGASNGGVSWTKLAAHVPFGASMRILAILTIALLASGCNGAPPPEPPVPQAAQEAVPAAAPVATAPMTGETLVAAWNDTRPYVNLRVEIVQTEDGGFDLRYGAIDGRGSPSGNTLVEVPTKNGRRFNKVDARNGDHYELLNDGSVRVADYDGVLYTKKVLDN